MSGQKSNSITNFHWTSKPLAPAVAACMLLLSPGVFAQTQASITRKSLSDAESETVRQLFLSALCDKTAEKFDSAAELFNKVIQIDPSNDASVFELANLYRSKSNYIQAQSLLEKVVSLSPDNKWYWLALADCYEKSNEITRLENVFKQLIRLQPDAPEYYFDQANVYFLQGRYDEALQQYNKLEEITGPTDELVANRQKIFLKQNKVDLAAGQLEDMIAANPSQIKYYLFLAELYNSNNSGDKALKILQSAAKINPANGLVHLALADIYRDKKNNEACFSELTLAFGIPDLDIDQKIKIILGYIPKFPEPNARASALELSKILAATHPGSAKAIAIYGDMLVQNEKLREATAMYKKSIALDSQVYEVQEQLVRIEISTNDLQGAIKDGENSLSFFPNQAWMNYLVGIAWLQQRNFDKALSYLKNTASLEALDKDLLSQCYSSLGDCYHDLKDYKNSDDSYDKALSYNGDNVYTLNNYAYYLSVRGEQLQKAASMSKHCNDLQPRNASFEDTYAWILFKQKDYTGAKLWMEKALADDKNNSPTKAEHYGDILFFLGNVDAAVENWKRAKTNGGSSPALEKKINEKKFIE